MRRPDATPVEGWLVEVFAPAGGRGPAPQRTDGTGVARFHDLSALGGYAVRVLRPDDAFGPVDGLHRTVDLSSRAVTEAAFVLPDARIEGVVLDGGTREAVPGAAVRAVEMDVAPRTANHFRAFSLARSDPERVLASTASDAKGRFVLEGAWRFVEVEASTADGREGIAFPKTAGGGVEVGLVVGVARAQRVELRGVVVDDTGRPIVGAEVTLRGPGGPARDTVTVTTDSSGRFGSPALIEGRWHVTVSRQSAPEAQGAAVLRADAAIRIVVPETTALAVTLIDEGTGDPVAGAAIELWHAVGASDGECPVAVTATVTGPDGKARLPTLPGTVSHIRVRAPGYAEATLSPPALRRGALLVAGGSDIESPLSAGELREVALQLRRGTVVTGRVVFADRRPVAGADVRAGGDWPFGDGASITTGEDGRFRLEGVLPSDVIPAARFVQVVASLQGHTSAEAPVEPSGTHGASAVEDVGDLVLHRTGCLRGRVLDREGNAVAGATLSLRAASGWREGRTDASGNYAIACDSWNRTDVTGVLSISAEGFLEAEVPLAVLPSPGNVMDAEPVVLSRVAARRLRVLDARGEPARGVRVWPWPWMDVADRAAVPVTAADGTVTLDGVDSNATLELRAEDGGRFTYHLSRSAAREATVRIPTIRRLEVRVVNEAANPWSPLDYKSAARAVGRSGQTLRTTQ